MADTEAPKVVEPTIEEKKAEEKEKVAEKKLASEEPKVEENGEKTENGNAKEEEVVKEVEEKAEPATTDKCSIKRKSTGGDAVDAKEESTPEKKAKVDSSPSVESEANGEVTESEAAA